MAIEEGKVYEVKVPEVGWRRENLAPWGSGKIELAAPRVTIYIDTEPGKRIGVELVEVDGVVEVERAWREELVDEDAFRYWVQGPFVTEEIRLLRDLTTGEVAKRLDVAVPTVTLWCRNGTLRGAYQRHTARGPVWLVPENALDGFQKPRRGKPSTADGQGEDDD